MTQQDIQPSEGPERPLDPPESEDTRPAFEDYPMADKLAAIVRACGDSDYTETNKFYRQVMAEALIEAFDAHLFQSALLSDDVSAEQTVELGRNIIIRYVLRCAEQRCDDLRDYIL